MPTWLVHGFRWPRPQVRIHTILQNLDHVAPEWLMAPATQACLAANFKQQWPDIMARLPALRFIEQYDPDDVSVKDQPYAYVCDHVHDIKLGEDIDELRARARARATPHEHAALAELRDHLTPDAKLAWFVVVNGDVERWAPPLDDHEHELEHDADDEDADTKTLAPPARPSTSRSMKKWIGGMLRKTRRYSTWLDTSILY
ncbi:hypothetical protein EJ07DRAFT_126465 [Lizonia empirigonia]|nr:hypothetical protein EJ07DRAFT_126465 [Lizonia empirigonia]